MAFSYSVIKETQLGDLKLIYGSFANDGDSTGGTVDLSRRLHSITFATIQHLGSSVIADSPAVNESLSGLPQRIDKATFTIKTTANANGLWFATGK